MHSPLKNLTPV